LILENSFKDPSGQIIQSTDFYITRMVAENYKEDFLIFYHSELYKQLIEKEFLQPILSVEDKTEGTVFHAKRICPVTYPYEWTFHQLKDAALLTLKIQKLALLNSYSLKDATPFNIVFRGHHPVFVDYFSFEPYKENSSWVAFEQFMKMFYLPLAIRQFTNINLNKDLITHIDGFELRDYAKLLPLKAYFNFYHLINLMIPYRWMNQNKRKQNQVKQNFPLFKQIKLIEFLFDAIKDMKPYKQLTTWNDYYSNTILENNYLNLKSEIITQWIQEKDYSNDTAIDFGTNNGYFAYMLHEKFKQVLATDIDFDSMDELYLKNKQEKVTSIVAFHTELHNPTPAIGWNLLERSSFVERFKAKLGTALAITHHLRITNNVPFELQAKFFASMVEELIIEYVDKKDPKVQILLSQKDDVYPTYSLEEFENAFEKYFIINKKTQIDGFERVLFKMERR
jgi:hypothetical protein